jgi:phage regulator Rha-like protein
LVKILRGGQLKSEQAYEVFLFGDEIYTDQQGVNQSTILLNEGSLMFLFNRMTSKQLDKYKIEFIQEFYRLRVLVINQAHALVEAAEIMVEQEKKIQEMAKSNAVKFAADHSLSSSDILREYPKIKPHVRKYKKLRLQLEPKNAFLLRLTMPAWVTLYLKTMHGLESNLKGFEAISPNMSTKGRKLYNREDIEQTLKDGFRKVV